MAEKTYSVVGKVEIGTDEYRELIEGKLVAEHDKDNYMRENWRKEDEIKKLKEERNQLQEELNKIKSIMKKGTSREDITSIIMEIFGEV